MKGGDKRSMRGDTLTYGHLDVRTSVENRFQMKLLTAARQLPYGRFMSQRNSHHSSANTYRPPTVEALLPAVGTLLLALVLLITNGGAG
jgi:hypothetical protein